MPIQLLDQENGGGGLLSDADQNPASAGGFYAKHGKQALETLLATIGLILLSPVFGLLACCIKLTSRGPVLYRQVRVGKDGRSFQILKFRSMVMQSLDIDVMITVAGDSRVTAMGKVLRRYKVDELPQLWNVIRGDMSLVGPRPELPIYVSEYTQDQRIVLSVRPGITDPASLAYRHEEEILAEQSDPEQFYRTQILPDKLARNRAYLRQITFRNDTRIILRTISSCLLPADKTGARRVL
jgi:lipopolysaccharide/colanic/teichoic acid biosynthesis glycosyltransferase